MWRMEDYGGVLYVGTFDASTTYQYSALGPVSCGSMMGFDLYAAHRRPAFFAVSRLNGFGDSFSFGLRTMQSTPDGLFLAAPTTTTACASGRAPWLRPPYARRLPACVR